MDTTPIENYSLKRAGDGATLSVIHYPHRKRPALCITEGSRSTVIGWLRDEEAVYRWNAFLQTAKAQAKEKAIAAAGRQP